MGGASKKCCFFLICLFLALSTFAVFWQIRSHEFVDFDDDWYIYNNEDVKAGLTRKGLVYAFTDNIVSHWHPLTILSLMLDCQLYGLEPGAHHLTSVLFHIANSLLLFIVLSNMTSRLWSSAFVAAAFALHPLHVESVAWASERKDLLSTFFLMLTVAAYIHYVRRPSISRYLLVLLTFVMGLMSKSMLVTLPVVLLLLDYWPLGRFQHEEVEGTEWRNNETWSVRFQWQVVYRLVREKIPFFVLSAVVCVVIFVLHRGSGFMKSAVDYPLVYRIENALVAYVTYVAKMFWPARLAIFYPHYFEELPVWKIAGSALLLFFITVLVVWKGKKHPYLVVGWLWYLGTLVPVSGLVQTGLHSMADRYTYIPLVGLFIIAAWGIPEVLSRLPYRKIVLLVSVAVLLPAWAVTSWFQVKHLRNSITMYRHAAEVIKGNWWAHYGLGKALHKEGRIAEANKEWNRATQIKIDSAVSKWQEQIQLRPYDADAHFNLGIALIWQRKYDEAIGHLNEALRMIPNWADAHYYLGLAYHRQGRYDLAIKHYKQTLQLKPDYPDAIESLKKALKRTGQDQPSP